MSATCLEGCPGTPPNPGISTTPGDGERGGEELTAAHRAREEGVKEGHLPCSFCMTFAMLSREGRLKGLLESMLCRCACACDTMRPPPLVAGHTSKLGSELGIPRHPLPLSLYLSSYYCWLSHFTLSRSTVSHALHSLSLSLSLSVHCREGSNGISGFRWG